MTSYSTDYSTDPAELLPDQQAPLTRAIAVEPHHFDQAVHLSDRVMGEARQWQTYLNALALFGFTQWLSEEAAELSIHAESASVLQPQYANVIEAVCHLSVGDFKLCLIAVGNLTDTVIKLPRAVVDLPEFAAHFYVVMRVLEEQGYAQVWGFLRYDQLQQHADSLHVEPDWTYSIPTTWFNRRADHLLLHLRCLEPTAIILPELPRNRLESLSHLQADLVALLPRLQSPDSELWQILTWEQGAAVLTSPPLLDWLYQLQTEGTRSLTRRLTEILHLLTQPAVNVGLWLRDELDEIAQSLSWTLLPSFAPIRSPVEEIDIALTQLRRLGIVVPTQARSGYKDVDLAGIPLRLYAVTWALPTSETNPEWTLLLILGTSSGHNLPPNIQLRVSDWTGVLAERSLPSNADDSYLYVRFSGTWDEKFLVTIGVNDTTMTLPPFKFQPDK
jgi:hypothetical protein